LKSLSSSSIGLGLVVFKMGTANPPMGITYTLIYHVSTTVTAITSVTLSSPSTQVPIIFQVRHHRLFLHIFIMSSSHLAKLSCHASFPDSHHPLTITLKFRILSHRPPRCSCTFGLISSCTAISPQILRLVHPVHLGFPPLIISLCTTSTLSSRMNHRSSSPHGWVGTRSRCRRYGAEPVRRRFYGGGGKAGPE
jgi:hypothetical protein